MDYINKADRNAAVDFNTAVLIRAAFGYDVMLDDECFDLVADIRNIAREMAKGEWAEDAGIDEPHLKAFASTVASRVSARHSAVLGRIGDNHMRKLCPCIEAWLLMNYASVFAPAL